MRDDYLSQLTGWDTDEDELTSLEPQNTSPVLPPVNPISDVPATNSNIPQRSSIPAKPKVIKPPIIVAPGSTPAAPTQTPTPAAQPASSVVTPAPGGATGWEEVATQIKTLMEFPNSSVLHIAIEGQTILIIDPMYKAYTWNVPLNDFPTVIGRSTYEVVKVAAGDPPALQGAGSDLAPLLWLIGINAYSGEPAPWLRKNERYKLMRWPNLTEFNLSLDQIYITSMLGNTPASIDELVLSSGSDEKEVINTINALSLMGILSVHPYQGAAGGLRFKRKKNGLFSKLRQRIGW